VRAAVPPLTTGSALATPPEVRAVLELSATRRLLPQLGATEVPMNMTGVFASDEDVVASWLLQRQGWIPFESFVTDNRTLTPFSFGLGISETRELMRSLDPIGTRLAENKLNYKLTKAENQFLLDALPAAALTRPPGLLSGITAVGSSPNADAELWDAVRGGEPVASVYITSKRGAKLLARWGTVTGGVRTFENVRTDGTGTIDGTRVLIAPEAGAKLILLDAAALLWSDGGLSITPSDETSIKPMRRRPRRRRR
jgi:hypothetical protein